MESRRRRAAGSPGLATSSELGVDAELASVGVSVAADEVGDRTGPLAAGEPAGTDRRSCEPAIGALVSGSERQSPELSRDTSMPGSSVSMCVRLLERPCKRTIASEMRPISRANSNGQCRIFSSNKKENGRLIAGSDLIIRRPG